MTCDPLAFTGPGAPLAYTGLPFALLLILAIAFLAAGAVVLLMTRRRGRAATTALLLLISGAAIIFSAAAPTPASADDCPPANNSLTIVQTSVMDGLAPGIAPESITGIVTNNGTDSTYITAIKVEITGVTTHVGSAPGTCDPSDYVLLDSLMPVGRTLNPGGGATEFTGASIGFSNKSTNQDACKGASVQLLYTANPG